MASLANRKPGDTYQQFLRIETSTGVTSSPTRVEDGVGNNTALLISKTQVKVDALVLGSDGPYASYDDLAIPKNISNLTDIAINSVSTGDTLVYNPYTNKWVNSGTLDGGNF